MRFERPPFQHRHIRRDDNRNAPREYVEREPAEESKEAEYLQQLAEEKTPVAIHLRTGETFRGFIEYYDKSFVRLTVAGGPNLFIFKHDIKYLFEE